MSVLAGCATVDEPLRGYLLAESSVVRQCAQIFKALDDAVARAGVRDAEAHPLGGFPYLRVDRFSASLRDAVAGDNKAQAQWVGRLQALDHDGRRVEIRNLPAHEIQALDGAGRASLSGRVARCADTLRDHDLASPERMAELHRRAGVPDAYRGWQRVAGLYGLTRVPFLRGIEQWQRETLDDFRAAAAGGPAALPLARYALAEPAVHTRGQIAAVIRGAADNPLRIPDYNSEQRALMAAAFAPVFEVETGGAHDRIGRVRWRATGIPDVDVSAPVVYYRVAFTRHRDYPGQTLTQLVYTVWFSQRPANHALDLLAGNLDGILLRVTLSPAGDPLIYDSIHPCGCYHLFFPTAGVQALPPPDSAQEWAFIPATLPAHTAGARIAVRVAARTHYIVKVALDQTPAAAQGYTLVPEDELRSLALQTNMMEDRRSLYGPQGLVPGTERGERYLFWPMGIPSAGAMRQWGHHATAFVGRRHFDDADLFDQRFRFAGDQAR